jgi:hypothetical protein
MIGRPAPRGASRVGSEWYNRHRRKPSSEEAMSDKADIRLTLPGDWWHLAAAFGAISTIPAPHPDRLDGVMTDAGYTFTAYHDAAGHNLGAITFAGRQGTTTIQVRVSWPRYDPYWREIIERLRGFSRDTRALRRAAAGATPDVLIERYYRSRAAGGKVTLKQLAETAGISPNYLYQKKMEYDRAGGRGSTTNKPPKKKN